MSRLSYRDRKYRYSTGKQLQYRNRFTLQKYRYNAGDGYSTGIELHYRNTDTIQENSYDTGIELYDRNTDTIHENSYNTGIELKYSDPVTKKGDI